MSTSTTQEVARPKAPKAKKKKSGARKIVALRFLGKQLGMYVVTGALALVLNFAIPRFMPGDPAVQLMQKLQQTTGATPTPEMIASIRAMYGDPTKNIMGQFFSYLGRVSHFDFGLSISHYPTPVSSLVLHALPWTIGLVGVTTLLTWFIGTALGIITGWRPGRKFDSGLTSAGSFLNGLPSFWVALIFLSIFAYNLHWAPASGGYDPTVPYSLNNLWFLLSILKYAWLPILVLVILGFSGWQFGMRNIMVTTIAEDYVQYARAKGLSNRRVMFGYAARNAMLPNVTGLASSLGGIVGGVMLIEMVFTYPGVGYLLFQAVQAKDFPVMQAIFFMITITALIFNFIADAIYVLLDPRTGEGQL